MRSEVGGQLREIPVSRFTTPAGTSLVSTTSPSSTARAFLRDTNATTEHPHTTAGPIVPTSPSSEGSSGAITPTTPTGPGTVKL
jgi:hypothetical protein